MNAPAVKPRADREGFTDSTGKTMDYRTGVREAARCIVNQHDSHFVESLILMSLGPDDILEWLVYPDTGEFAT